MEYKSELHNEEGRLATIKLCKDFQHDSLENLMNRVRSGEPFAICNGDEVEEIFHSFNAPVIPLQYWSSVVASKRLSIRYFNFMAEKGYDQDPYYSLGLACTMANDGDAPYGGLPKPLVIVGNSAYDSQQTIKELWAKEFGCPYFPMESVALGSAEAGVGLPPKWWERIHDHWDEMCDPEALDLRVSDMKNLIHFVEVNTGKSFHPEKLTETLETLNEQEGYYAKVRDIIAETSPCPVSLRDQMAMYPINWWRGLPSGRDVAKQYYEDVLERIENGTCVYKDEKIRLFWTSQGLWTNTKFYHAFEEKYGAVFVGSIYQSCAADLYARDIKGDPLRCMAGRQHAFGVADPNWIVKEAFRHGCVGAVGQAPCPEFAAAGMPFLNLGGSNVDARKWDEEAMEALVGKWIEEEVIPYMEKQKAGA